jgi:hypothetical protein
MLAEYALFRTLISLASLCELKACDLVTFRSPESRIADEQVNTYGWMDGWMDGWRV